MKNLINLLNAKAQKEMTDFCNTIDASEDVNTWYYSSLIPRGSKRLFSSISEKKDYLKARKQKAIQRELDKSIKRILLIENSPDMCSAVVSIEWNKSRTWGNNPNASVSVEYFDHSRDIFNTGSVSGYGYDKESTAFANAMNQSNSFLKALYLMKDANIDKSNHDLFGYGSGYGVLPYLEGGVGVSCFYRIFERIGFTMRNAGSGKKFDVYTIDKKQS